MLCCAVLLQAAAGAFALELRGPLVQGGVVIGRTAPGTPVWLEDRPVRVSAQGLFVIGFDRDAPASQRLRVGGDSLALSIAPRRYDVQKVTGIAQRIMSPTPEDLARIAREQRLIDQARVLDDPRTDFAVAFEWPIRGRISGVYGSQRWYNGTPSRPHYGVDVAAPTGAPVHAPAPGTVTLAEPDLFYSGGTVIIDHGHGLSSSFLHLSRLLVRVGQQLETGDPVAEVGATGRATGPHLDWRMRWHDAQVDPQLLAGPMDRKATSYTDTGGAR